jgi:hypothetical protein
MEGIFRNWNPFVVHSKKPITGKPNQKGCQNQQASINNGAPPEECSNHVVIHGRYPFWFLRLTRSRWNYSVFNCGKIPSNPLVIEAAANQKGETL